MLVKVVLDGGGDLLLEVLGVLRLVVAVSLLVAVIVRLLTIRLT